MAFVYAIQWYAICPSETIIDWWMLRSLFFFPMHLISVDWKRLLRFLFNNLAVNLRGNQMITSFEWVFFSSHTRDCNFLRAKLMSIQNLINFAFVIVSASLLSFILIDWLAQFTKLSAMYMVFAIWLCSFNVKNFALFILYYIMNDHWASYRTCP